MGLFNALVHPRNPYRERPDFQQLVIDYPELRQFAEQDLTGKVRINFKDKDALICFTRILLKKDFNLNVEIPKNTLVPTLTQRLNYLLWIEDLLNSNEISTVTGIDIGTGATCIFALLGAKKFSWKMLATEADKESFDCARKNVENNNLQNLINVKAVDEEKVLSGVIDKDAGYHFCMCNPPFFADEWELHSENKARTDHRSQPGNAQTGSAHELVTPGGEVSFVSRIIQDSVHLKDAVKIYTSMIGHKKNVKKLLAEIKKSGAVNSTQTVFFQGKTMRWGIAWTFDPNIKLSGESLKEKKKKESTYSVQIPQKSEDLTTMKDRLLRTFEDLEILVKATDMKESSFGAVVTAFQNTWCRKYRRQKKSKSQEQATTAHGKRGAPDDFTESEAKRSRLESPVLLHMSILVTLQEENFNLVLTYMDGSGGKESAFNFLKYIARELETEGNE